MTGEERTHACATYTECNVVISRFSGHDLARNEGNFLNDAVVFSTRRGQVKVTHIL